MSIKGPAYYDDAEDESDSSTEQAMNVIMLSCLEHMAHLPNTEWASMSNLELLLKSWDVGYEQFMSYVLDKCSHLGEIIKWTNSPVGPIHGQKPNNSDNIPVDIHFEPATQRFLREEYERNPRHNLASLMDLMRNEPQLRDDRVHSCDGLKSHLLCRWWNVWATFDQTHHLPPAARQALSPIWVNFTPEEEELIQHLYSVDAGYIPDDETIETMCSNMWCYEFDRISFMLKRENITFQRNELMLRIIAENQNHCVTWINKYFELEPLFTDQLNILYSSNRIASQQTYESAESARGSLETLRKKDEVLHEVNEQTLYTQKRFKYHFKLQNDEMYRPAIDKFTQKQRYYYDNLINYDIFLANMIKFCNEKIDEYYESYRIATGDTAELLLHSDWSKAFKNLHNSKVPKPTSRESRPRPPPQVDTQGDNVGKVLRLN